MFQITGNPGHIYSNIKGYRSNIVQLYNDVLDLYEGDDRHSMKKVIDTKIKNSSLSPVKAAAIVLTDHVIDVFTTTSSQIVWDDDFEDRVVVEDLDYSKAEKWLAPYSW